MVQSLQLFSFLGNHWLWTFWNGASLRLAYDTQLGTSNCSNCRGQGKAVACHKWRLKYQSCGGHEKTKTWCQRCLGKLWWPDCDTGIMLRKGNYPDISLFQVSELFRFPQNDIPNIPGYDVTIFSDPSDGFVDQYPNVGEYWCLWFLSLWRLNPKQCLFHIQVNLLIFSYSHIFPLFHIPTKKKAYELIWSMFIYVFLAKNMYAKNTQLALKLLGTNCLFVLAHHKQGLLQRIVVVPLQKKKSGKAAMVYSG